MLVLDFYSKYHLIGILQAKRYLGKKEHEILLFNSA